MPDAAVANFKKQDTDIFQPGRATFLFAGVHSFNMDLMNLMEALRQLADRTRDFTCIFIGFGEAKQGMQKFVCDNDLDDNVVFLDFMPRSKLMRYICAADFCLSTRVKDEVYQDFVPVKMLEYMACNKFVIAAHECVFTARAAEAGNAVVSPAGAPTPLAKNMLRAIEERDKLRSNLSSKAFILKNFSIECFETRMSAVFDVLVES